MGRFNRDFFPRKFTCETMRPWDNFFWWVEMDGLPPRSMVDPAYWPPKTGALPAQVKARRTENNGITIRTAASEITVWLSPKIIDFDRRATITVNGRRLGPANQKIRPSLETLLEDVRTRGDRQHPFWAKLTGPTGRVHGR